MSRVMHPRCGCGHARSDHRQANHLKHERGACRSCACKQYTPGHERPASCSDPELAA